MTQPAGVVFDALYFTRRMSRIDRTITVKSFQFLFRKKTTICQHYIQCLNRMAFTLDISVAPGIVERLRCDI